jgi:O-antigen/teichoic acid export membrane protein
MSNQKSSNFNQVLWLGIGQIGTYVIAFLSTIILSRYLSKTDYGTYSQIIYVYMTLMSIFTIGLPSIFSYYIPRLSSSQQKTLIDSLNKIFLYLGAIFSLVLYFSSSIIAGLLKNPELAIGLKIFAIFPLFTLPTLGVEGLYTALRKTKEVAFYQIYSRTLMLLCIVLPVVLYQPNYRLAIIGWGVASFLSFIMAMYMKRKPYMKIENEFIPNMYKSIFDYSLPLLGAFVAGFFITSADQFFISRYYGTDAFADYSAGSYGIPLVAVISASLKKVLMPLFSKAEHEGKIDGAVQSYINAVNKSIKLVFPLVVYAVFFTSYIVLFIYGEKYSTSYSFMRNHLIRDFLQIFPYFSVFLALGMSRIYLNMHIYGVVFVWVLDFIVVRSGLDASYIVLVRTMFGVFSTIYAMIYLFKVKKINLMPSIVIKQIFIVMLHSTLCAFLIFQLNDVFFWGNYKPLITLIITFILYYILLIASSFVFKINYLELILNFRKK